MRPPQANRPFARPKDNMKQIQRMKKSDLLKPPHKPAKTKP
jgi:hypothetical protein